MPNKLLLFCCWLFLLLPHLSYAQPIALEFSEHSIPLEIEYRIFGEKHTVDIESQKRQVDIPYSRYLPIKLWNKNNRKTPLYDGIIKLQVKDNQLYFNIDPHQEFAHLGNSVTQEKQTLFFSLWWVFVFLMTASLLIWKTTQPTKKQPHISISLAEWSEKYNFLFWLFVSCLWLYPLFQSDELLARNHDGMGTLWFIWSAKHWSFFTDNLSGWPQGINYGQLDSFVLWFFAKISPLSPLHSYQVITILGLTVSTWATEYLAVSLGAKRPYSWMAGFGFLGSGLVAVTILEGHVYHLFQPWLPLFTLYWWKACSLSSTKKQAMSAGIFFMLSLLSSAYLGLNALLILLFIWLGKQGWKQQNSYWIGTILLPFFIVYIGFFIHHNAENDIISARSLASGSSNLSNILGITDSIDQKQHSLGLGILPTTFVLSLLAPFFLSWKSRPYIWLNLAITSLLISFGTALSLGDSATLTLLPLYFFRQLPVFNVLDFPLRMAWVFVLSTSVLSALVLSRSSRFFGNLRWLFFFLLIGDFLLITRLPKRLNGHSTDIPSAFFALDDSQSTALFSLLPLSLQEADPNLDLTALQCFFQTQHHLPIADDCVTVHRAVNPRYQRTQKLIPAIFAGNPHAVQQELYPDFSHLIVHPDLFSETDWRQIAQTLSQIDPSPISTKDGGLWTLLYDLSNPIQASAPKELISEAKSLQIIFAPKHSNPPYKLRLKNHRQQFSTVQLQPLHNSDHAQQHNWQTIGISINTVDTLEYEITDATNNTIADGEISIANASAQIFIDEEHGRQFFFANIQSPKMTEKQLLIVLSTWLGLILLILMVFLLYTNKLASHLTEISTSTSRNKRDKLAD